MKKQFQSKKPQYYLERQLFKLSQDRKSKAPNDSDSLAALKLEDGAILYFKDLGPQIGWTTVFLCEYAGPLFVYLLFYLRPTVVYGAVAATAPISPVVHIAAGCWTLHYVKRLLETIFVHRFSHSTMPIMNLFKNCGYYWGFAAFVSYFTNHPLYTPPCYGYVQILTGLAIFLMCEFGNFSIHIALRDLRPPGSKERKIPVPTENPLTGLFRFVSCPNYTYEVGAWLGFSIMTQTLPALLFATVGFYQMAVWALGKHRNYKKEFQTYPKERKAILPFVL